MEIISFGLLWRPPSKLVGNHIGVHLLVLNREEALAQSRYFRGYVARQIGGFDSYRQKYFLSDYQTFT
jgi:hypothetical protein